MAAHVNTITLINKNRPTVWVFVPAVFAGGRINRKGIQSPSSATVSFLERQNGYRWFFTFASVILGFGCCTTNHTGMSLLKSAGLPSELINQRLITNRVVKIVGECFPATVL